MTDQGFSPKVAEGGASFSSMMPSGRKRRLWRHHHRLRPSSKHKACTRISSHENPSNILCIGQTTFKAPYLAAQIQRPYIAALHRVSPGVPTTTGVHHHWSLEGGPPPHLTKPREHPGNVPLLLVTVTDPIQFGAKPPDGRRSSTLERGTTTPSAVGFLSFTCRQRLRPLPWDPGVIINTFSDLEDAELQKIIDGMGVPVYAIGPLHKISLGAQSSLLAQDRTCLDWLDKQEVGSVLFVSFGSLASMDQEELVETAWGLANSRMPFLWVIRPDSVQGSGKIGLPDGFEEEAQDRGMVVSWAPQQEVLGHQAVGGFWTHNGWNSTLESISEGVPMICRPHFGDQMINARYVQEVWKIGFRLEGKMDRDNIQRSVKKLFCHDEGGEMRRRANNLKDKATRCIMKGGSSQTGIDLLVNCIMTLPSSI
ncbi:UDP-glycosyltransferase 76E2 [Triticum urartu]|uniref:UDP-glycosyltransferase 76E2 n=1 Tax=Triticum urartu TaxID=4572 RepID=M7ZFC0_TRIUA|nr:UDP-glycosyltransferase 76E2 [Triticum urartu]